MTQIDDSPNDESMTHDEFKSPFECFVQHEQENTIQYFGNGIFDEIFSFKNIQDSDVTELEKLMEHYCNDKLFNQIVIKLFNKEMNSYNFKSSLQNLNRFPIISSKSAQMILSDVFKGTENVNVKLYVLFLTTSIENLFDEAEEKFKILGIYNGAFYHFFTEFVSKSISKMVSKEGGLNIHDKFCLLSFITQNDTSSNGALPANMKYFNVVLDYNKCSSFNDVWKQLVSNYDALHPVKTQGFNINGSFENAVKIFGYVAPSWDNLSATFALRNKPLPTINPSFGMSGGYRVSDSDVVKVFTGDYSIVPSNEAQDSSVNVDVISNFSSFNQLPNTRKLQVSHFLINNRKRFNDILSESAQIVINGLKSKLVDSDISDVFERNQFAPSYARKMGFGNENGMIQDSMTFVRKLKSSFESAPIKTFDQAINFIVHNYIPLLSQFENRCNHKYGASESRSILSKYATDKVLNVIGVSSMLDIPAGNVKTVVVKEYVKQYVPAPAPAVAPSSTSLSGGKVAKKKNMEPLNKDDTTNTGPPDNEDGFLTTFDSQSSPTQLENSIVEGGSSTSSENLINALIEGQKKFNKEYESIYRNLISALNTVNISNVQAQTFSKLYAVCNQFESIAIKSNKTTSYISGYYGARNYNKLYTACVDNTITAIQAANVSAFNNVVSVLQSLKRLLTNTARNVQELRTKFLNAPKDVSEMLIVASKNVKQPCSLTSKDFNALSDAIARIANSIRTYTSETNIYSTKQQLENYLSKVEDRSKVINEHYDRIILMLKNVDTLKRAQTNVSNRELDYAREAQINIQNQIRDCMLYLNKTFDAKLTEKRISDLKNVNLSQQQIDSIEKAFLAFKNVQITTDFKREMEKLAKALNPITVGSIFKLIKKLKKLIVRSQYINFITQLYKELNIFDGSFNWTEFTDKLTNLIVLSSLFINDKLKVDNEYHTELELCHLIAYEFEKEFNRQNVTNGVQDYPAHLTNSAYNFMYDYLTEHYSADSNMSKISDLILSPMEITKLNSFIQGLGIPAGNLSDLAALRAVYNNARVDQNALYRDVLYNDRGVLLDPFKDMFNAGPQLAPDNNLYDMGSCLRSVLNANPVPTVSNGFMCVLQIYYTLMSKYIKALQNQNDQTNLPYYIKHMPVYLAVLYRAMNVNPNSPFYTFINKSVSQVNDSGVYVSSNKTELPIAKYVIDSLFANVVAVVDKYWSVKYTGTLPIPLNINMVLRGGDKQEGGTIFDSMPLHDQTQSSVIPEAVPFYICAFYICQYYITTFNVGRVQNEHELVLNINKISVLYPIYELFSKYQATIGTLTPTQMKTALAVFNEIWNQSQGNDAARLSRSIDMLFNELNACFIFTDKLQLEIIKSTNSLSKTAVDVLNEKLTVLVEKMKETLNNSIVEFNENPEDQSKRLESILNRAFNKVKAEPESQRLAKLKSLLVDDDKDGNLKDFYKFMELVVSPMLISAKSYVQIFSLFDSYSFDSENPGNVAIDFSGYQIVYKDPTEDITNPKRVVATAWELINEIRNGRRMELKALFIEHPLVLKYNKMKLNESLDNYHKSGRYILPNFWIVMDESTYPTEQKPSFNIPANHIMNDNIALMRQIWPTVQAKTVADYYNHCVTEFISDYDHFIHNFLSYPGISDKTIKIISKAAHDAIKIKNVSSKVEDVIDPNNRENFRNTGVYDIKDTEGLFPNAKKLANIPVNKSKSYIYPPPYPEDVIIPRFNDLTPIEELTTTASVSTDNKLNVQVDGTGIYIKSQSANQDKIKGCEYTWLDWVIFQLAKCDKTNFCIPYKLLQIIQDYPGLNSYLRMPGYEKKSNKQMYNRSTDGTYVNIITQNIIARSSSIINKEKGEYATLNNSWIGSLVAITPYLINVLMAHKLSIDQSVTYNRNSVQQCLTNLIDVLTIFYDDLSNYAPFMPFMTDSVQIYSSKAKPHIFGELLSFINKNNLSNMDSTDYIKLEWANMWFFTGIDNITFPDYKNRDRYEWIKTFASDKVSNGTFKTEFDTTLQTLGRNVWAGLIAKTADYNVDYKNVYRELDEIIIRIINIMSECDTDLIQHYVNNIIDEYTKNMKTGLVGHGLNGGLSGGNEANKTQEYVIPEDLKEFVERITKGLVSNNTLQIDDGSVDYSNVDSKKPLTSGNIYKYYAHVPKDIEAAMNVIRNQGTPSVNDYKTIKSLSQILSSKGFKEVVSSINMSLPSYLENILGKVGNDLKNAKEIHTMINKFTQYESEFRNEVNTIATFFDPNIMEDVTLNDYLKYTAPGVNDNIYANAGVAAGAGGVYHYDQTVPEMMRAFVRNRVFNGIHANDNVDYIVDRRTGHRLFTNIGLRPPEIVKSLRYVERVIAYYQLVSVGMIYCLKKFIHKCFTFVNNIVGTIPAAHPHQNITDLIHAIFNYYQNIANKFCKVVNATMNTGAGNNRYEHICVVDNPPNALYLTEYIDRAKANILLLLKVITSPVCSGRCQDLLFKLPIYDNVYNNHVLGLPGLARGPVVEILTNEDAFLSSVDFIFISFKSTLNCLQYIYSRQRSIDLANDGLENTIKYSSIIPPAVLQEDKFGLGKDTALISNLYINIAGLNQALNRPDYNGIDTQGRISLSGGLYSPDKIDTIYAVAAGFAKAIKNRAIYIDPNQNINSCPILVSGAGNLVNTRNYLYKYLYNPNQCALFNKTTMDNTSYAIANIGHARLFILDPADNLAFNDLIDFNKVKPKLSSAYKKGFDAVNGGLAANIDRFYQDMAAGDGAARNKFSGYTNLYRNIFNVNIVLQAPQGQNPPAHTHYLYNLKGEQGDRTLLGALPNNVANITFNLVPGVLNVNYDNTHTTIKPKTHTVTLDDKMFMLIPFTKPVQQHIFSPQKDIYNATLIDSTQMASPTILTDADAEPVTNFNKHIRNLAALDATYTTCIGNPPQYDVSLSNYKNFETNPIYTFIELLLRNNIETLFKPEESINYSNFGFDIGSTNSLSGHGLLGGYNISNAPLYSRLINIDSIITGNNEMEILGSAYNIDGSQENNSALSDGKLLYSYIFRSDFNGGICDAQHNGRKMFSLILNYFHKYNVSFNCMFNQLCYPSILFNASALRLSIERLNKLISRFDNYNLETNKSYRSNNFKVIKAYIGNYVDSNNKVLALDKADDYRFQINFGEPRNPFMSLKDIIDKLEDNNANAPDYSKNKLLWLCNQYAGPSVASNFLVEFLKYVTIDTNETEENKKFKPLQQLFASSIPEMFRHFDSITTFVNVLFMLLKQTSYYDHEYDKDMSFFNVQNPEPFSVT